MLGAGELPVERFRDDEILGAGHLEIPGRPLDDVHGSLVAGEDLCVIRPGEALLEGLGVCGGEPPSREYLRCLRRPMLGPFGCRTNLPPASISFTVSIKGHPATVARPASAARAHRSTIEAVTSGRAPSCTMDPGDVGARASTAAPDRMHPRLAPKGELDARSQLSQPGGGGAVILRVQRHDDGADPRVGEEWGERVPQEWSPGEGHERLPPAPHPGPEPSRRDRHTEGRPARFVRHPGGPPPSRDPSSCPRRRSRARRIWCTAC